MKYVLQIKESIFPRLKANQYYYLGDIDETILYGSVPLFERFLKSGSEFIGFVPFDELTPIEQANILSKVEKSKNHPEFLQYQLLRVVESLKQPNATIKTEQKPRKKRTTVTKQKIEQAIKIVARCPEIYNYEVCTLIGVDENCASNNPDGRPKALRLAIDRTREANASGGCYITGDKDIKEARDSFYNDSHIDDGYDNY